MTSYGGPRSHCGPWRPAASLPHHIPTASAKEGVPLKRAEPKGASWVSNMSNLVDPQLREPGRVLKKLS